MKPASEQSEDSSEYIIRWLSAPTTLLYTEFTQTIIYNNLLKLNRIQNRFSTKEKEKINFKVFNLIQGYFHGY